MELIYHDLRVWLIGKSTDSKAVKIKIETEICSILWVLASHYLHAWELQELKEI